MRSLPSTRYWFSTFLETSRRAFSSSLFTDTARTHSTATASRHFICKQCVKKMNSLAPGRCGSNICDKADNRWNGFINLSCWWLGTRLGDSSAKSSILCFRIKIVLKIIQKKTDALKIGASYCPTPCRAIIINRFTKCGRLSEARQVN